MEKIKRLVASIVVVLIVVINFMPEIAYAEGNTSNGKSNSKVTKQEESQGEQEEIGRVYEIKEEETWDVSENQDESVIAKWTLNNKTLTISGSGEMKDWEGYSKEDWHSTQYTNLIETVIIQNEINNISTYAFYGCSNLSEIEIANSVISIEKYAFRDCSSLTNIDLSENIELLDEGAFLGCINLREIEISNNITTISNSVFKNCSNLDNINISENVTTIKNNAFANCTNLKSINISKNVEKIGESAFIMCKSLENINVEESNQNYKSIDGILYSQDETTLLRYTPNKTASSFIIPNNVTDIGEYAFDSCKNLLNIEISSNVINLGDFSFKDCTNLKEITIPNSVLNIGRNILYNCKSLVFCYTNSKAHQYLEENRLPYLLLDNNVSNIGIKYKLENERSWNISNDESENVIAKWTLEDRTLRISGNGQMKNWSILSVLAPDLFNSDGDWKQNKYIGFIENIIIENGVKNIGDFAFFGIDVSIVANSNQIVTQKEGDSITVDLDTAGFSGYNNLKNIEIPNSVTSIGEFAFGNCLSLKNINIPNSVTSIGECAFSNCFSLKNINISNSVISIEKGAFSGCSSLQNIDIPDSIITIGENAFAGCDGLKDVKIPNSVTKIDDGAFDCENLEDISVDLSNQNYISIDGILYSKDRKEIIHYPANKKQKDFTIPNSVTTIGKKAFKQCNGLTNISIPDYVENIEQDAFKNCKFPLICKVNSETHRYAESEKIGYIIDKAPPKLEVSYTTNEEKVFVTIMANEKVQEIDNWQLSEDGLKLTKEYNKNVTEEVIIKDLVGNETKITVVVNNIFNLGDLNQNEQIDIGDTLLLLRYIAQSNNLDVFLKHPDWKISDEMIKIGDLNKNNEIDIGDILQLQRYIVAKNNENIAKEHPNWLIIK